MTDLERLALLPEGLRDDLPVAAAFEAAAIEWLMGSFARYGYERVKPPLVEFEDSLLSGTGASLAPQTFRLMDPVSQRMMAFRADITPQIARIAQSRLAKAPRPLRLSYAGEVLRVRGSQLRADRQFVQVGAELIGVTPAAAIDADAEIMLMAALALGAYGVKGLSIDLALPTLVPVLARELGLDAAATQIAREALDHKDGPALDLLPSPAREMMRGLLDATGKAERAAEVLASLSLPPEAAALVQEARSLVAKIRAAGPAENLALTLDPGEYRGFEYQTGISFTLFAKGIRGELGRGGRYMLISGEHATGFTVYMDTLLRALPEPKRRKRIYLPPGTTTATAEGLRQEEWDTVAGLGPAPADAAKEARRLGCSHVLIAGKPTAL
jgi:ATP phosphoribosyltransferase regulatory subunit